MKLSLVAKPSARAVVIYPVYSKEKPHDAAVAKFIQQLEKNKEFEAKSGQLFYKYDGISNLASKVIFVGMGEKKKLDYAAVLDAIASAVKSAKSHKEHTVCIIMDDELGKFGQAVGEAAVLANYNQARQWKTGKSAKTIQEQHIDVLEVTDVKKNSAAHHAIEKGILIAEVKNDLRDWINSPPNIANPEFFDQRAKEAAKASGAKLKILKNKELKKLGCGAILAVNRGSPDDARLIVMDYNPHGAKKDETVALVGKGIIFDSGGYNLKPSGHIEDMQLDKSGAATVIAFARLLKKLNIKRRVIITCAMTENLIGPLAQKPSEIIKSYSGKTIEVTNTDAEGRLVLADAIAYTIKGYKPKYLIDLATLTGACMVALGYRYAGLFGNDKELAEKIRKAGDEINEDLWPMPIHKEHHEQIKGTFADIQNTSTVRYAGASTAAAFLEEFVDKKTKWAHLDIAGPAFTQTPKKYETKGATGFGLRTLVRFMEELG